MTLTLRSSDKLWKRLVYGPFFVEALQDYLDDSTMRLFEQTGRVRTPETDEWHEERFQMMVDEEVLMKLILRSSEEFGVDYDIVDVTDADQTDGTKAESGRFIDEDLYVLAPDACPNTDEFVLIMNREAYGRLAAPCKSPIVLAWSKLRRACAVYHAGLGNGQVLFLFSAVDRATPHFTTKDLTDLNDALTEAKVGCVEVDPYEVGRAKELCRKFGTITGGSDL